MIDLLLSQTKSVKWYKSVAQDRMREAIESNTISGLKPSEVYQMHEEFRRFNQNQIRSYLHNEKKRHQKWQQIKEKKQEGVESTATGIDAPFDVMLEFSA